MVHLLSILFILLSYLLGGLNAAILLCKYKGWEDPRLAGSKNPGATNMLRLHQAQAASIVLIFDLLKGTIPVYVGYWLGFSPIEVALIAMAACLGHIYPIYFQFKGGKAVATGLGCLLPLGMDLTGLLLITWLATLALTGFSSLAAIIAAIAAPFYIEMLKPEYTQAVSMLSILVVAKHIPNIRRLLTGKEKKIVNWKQK